MLIDRKSNDSFSRRANGPRAGSGRFAPEFCSGRELGRSCYGRRLGESRTLSTARRQAWYLRFALADRSFASPSPTSGR